MQNHKAGQRLRNTVAVRKRECGGYEENSATGIMEKMFCRILLLLSLTSCGMFEHRYMGLRYQAEEGSNITVEWSFSSRDDISIPSLKIHCVSVLELKVFYHQDSSVDESLHEQFAGRVQCDKDALRTGRVRLLVSRVRTDDSGLYLCRMRTEFGRKVKQFSLNITAAVDEPKPVTPEPSPETPEPASEPAPEGRGRVCLYVVLGLTAAALAACCSALSYSALKRKQKQQSEYEVSAALCCSEDKHNSVDGDWRVGESCQAATFERDGEK